MGVFFLGGGTGVLLPPSFSENTLMHIHQNFGVGVEALIKFRFLVNSVFYSNINKYDCTFLNVSETVGHFSKECFPKSEGRGWTPSSFTLSPRGGCQD